MEDGSGGTKPSLPDVLALEFIDRSVLSDYEMREHVMNTPPVLLPYQSSWGWDIPQVKVHAKLQRVGPSNSVPVADGVDKASYWGEFSDEALPEVRCGLPGRRYDISPQDYPINDSKKPLFCAQKYK